MRIVTAFHNVKPHNNKVLVILGCYLLPHYDTIPLNELRRLIFGDLVRMPISRIQLLGNFQLTSDDQVVTALNDEREQTLLESRDDS